MTESERRCLRSLAGLDPLAAPCADLQTLYSLESRGLIERVVVQWLPLEMRRLEYRLTQAGRALLEP